MDAGKGCEQGYGSFAPSKQIGRTADLHGCKPPHRGAAQGSAAYKSHIAILCKAFAVKKMNLKNVQSNE